MDTKYKLIKYRDAGMMTFTYFWTDDKEQIVGPFFDTEKLAEEWFLNNMKSEDNAAIRD